MFPGTLGASTGCCHRHPASPGLIHEVSREQTGPQSPAPAPPLLSCSPSSPASRAITQDLDPSPILGNCPMWHGGLWKWADGARESWVGGPYCASRFPGTLTTISQIQPGQGLFLHHSELRRANFHLSRTPGWKMGMGVGQCDHEPPRRRGAPGTGVWREVSVGFFLPLLSLGQWPLETL